MILRVDLNIVTSRPGTSTIGDQDHMLPVPAAFKCTGAEHCQAELAALCCTTPGCVAFSINEQNRTHAEDDQEEADTNATATTTTRGVPPWSCSLFNCTCQGESDYYGVVAGKGFGCTPPAAQAWWSAHGCNTHPRSGGNCGGPACHLPGHTPCIPAPPTPAPPVHHMVQLYSSTKLWPRAVGPGWATYSSTRPPAPPHPPPPTFKMDLDLATSTVTVTTDSVVVTVWVELNAPLVRI